MAEALPGGRCRAFGEVGVAVVIPRPGVALDGEAIISTSKSQLASY